MLRELEMEWKHVPTYATEKALRKRIDQDKALYPDHDDRFFIIRTPEGRWTAIVKMDYRVGGYVGRYAFMKV